MEGPQAPSTRALRKRSLSDTASSRDTPSTGASPKKVTKTKTKTSKNPSKKDLSMQNPSTMVPSKPASSSKVPCKKASSRKLRLQASAISQTQLDAALEIPSGMADLTTFPLFPKLAPELRTRIWKIALAEVNIRVIEVTFNPEPSITRSPIRSPLLLVNQEARYEAEKIFKVFQWENDKFGARVDWDRDVVFFNTNTINLDGAEFMASLSKTSWRHECRRLALSHFLFLRCMSHLAEENRNVFLQEFELLEDLFIEDVSEMQPLKYSVVGPGNGQTTFATKPPPNSSDWVADIRRTLVQNENGINVSLVRATRIDGDSEPVICHEHRINPSGSTDLSFGYQVVAGMYLAMFGALVMLDAVVTAR